MSLEKTNELVSMLLRGRTVAHMAHWATDSYSQHQALGAFYEGLGELLDRFVESYQGYADKRVAPTLDAANPKESPVAELELDMDRLARLRYQVVPQDETCLQNILDEIESLYQTTLYKLRMLK